MIKIIKEGQKEFVGNCNDCGCEFSYDIHDVALGSVPCPCCGHYYVHKLPDMKKKSKPLDSYGIYVLAMMDLTRSRG